MSEFYQSKNTGAEIDAAVTAANVTLPNEIVTLSDSITDLNSKKADKTEVPKSLSDLGFNSETYSVNLEKILDTDSAKRYLIKQGENIIGYIDVPNSYTKGEVDSKLSSVYKYKGTVNTINDLPTTGLTVGDVYNIETAGILDYELSASNNINVKAGDNVAWTENGWDILAGIVDTSVFALKQTENGGFTGGNNANANTGGAIGQDSSATGGGAIGDSAYALDGGAVGKGTVSYDGGAVGSAAMAGDGFAGGKNAQTMDYDKSEPVDAVQLGTGINSNPKTLQVYNYTLMNADGSIPDERLTNTYTKTEMDTALNEKADKATTLAGYGITDAYTKAESDSLYVSNDSETKYIALNIGETASNVINGLCKFSLKGKVEPRQHATYHKNATNKYVPLQHTMGTISVMDGSNSVSSFNIDLFGRDANSDYGFTEAKDEITENGLKRVWSKDFFITSSYDYTVETPSNNSNNRIHIFTIPEAAFGDELPKQNGIIEPICSFANPCTKEWIYNYSDSILMNYYNGYYVAMEYVSSEKVYKVYFLTNNITINTLLNTKLFIIYELNTPIYDYHTNKIYLKDGYKVTFEQKSVELITTVKTTYSMSTVPITASIQAPINISAVLNGFEQATININDLNDRVDNIEVVGGHLGVADGVTDDSDAIQNLINNAETTNGLITDIIIPEGKYALGKSLELTKSNLRLIGNGNVILKPTGNFPAIKVYRPSNSAVADVTIENIKIYLPNQALPDGDFEGSHSGIYIDGSYTAGKGLYRVSVKDVTINGAYRYDWQDTDKSYGIYCKDNTLTETYAYFCNFENINVFSVYCGLYLGERVNCSNVKNFHWDKHDVNGYDGGVIATMGVAYGIICNSSCNFIDFRGQSIGDDSGSWCYKDYNNNQYSLTDVIGSENVNTINGIDYFASGYTVNFHEQIVVNEETIDVFLGKNNLSKVGVICSGTYNLFSGHIYDPQRSDYQYLFTTKSQHNRYYYPTADINGGNTNTYTTFNVDLYGTGSKDQVQRLDYEVIKDLGYENICVNPTLSQKESFVSDNFINGADDVTTTVAHSKHFGMQDNALAYADKFSTINVYQLDGDVQSPVTVDGVNANQIIKEVFDPKSLNVGFRNGITFDQSPAYDSPIYIDIEFNDDFSISYLSRFGIQFNQYIAEDFEVLVKLAGETNYSGCGVVCSRFLRNTSPHATFLAYVVASDGTMKTWENVRGIRIAIRHAYSTATYNTDRKVGISLIWATDANHGGNAWFPKGGGELYGDINLQNNFIKLGMVDTLPEASENYRGKHIILKDDNDGDKLYACLFDGANFSWSKFAADLTFDESPTAGSINPVTSEGIKVEIDKKTDKTAITASTGGSITLADNTEFRVADTVTSISLTVPDDIPNDFISSVVFKSGTEAMAIDYSAVSPIWRGDDVTDGVFIPLANKVYNVIFYNDGFNITAVAGGYDI